ncbi:MAG: hypothetical protein LLG06_19610 [Desulfobacteraceae bacterium]|nr:hypothetical protein [Desulfobacteraceae bacterium]
MAFVVHKWQPITGAVVKDTAKFVLLFKSQPGEAAERLHGMLREIVSNARMETETSLDGLMDRLRRQGHRIAVAVLFIATKNDLLGLLQQSNPLRDIRTILILPDRDIKTAIAGHVLYPRFISYTDGDFGDVTAVLAKMIRNLSMDRLQGQLYSTKN